MKFGCKTMFSPLCVGRMKTSTYQIGVSTRSSAPVKSMAGKRQFNSQVTLSTTQVTIGVSHEYTAALAALKGNCGVS